MEVHFFDLNTRIPELRDGFGLDTTFLEREMKSKNGGIDLANIDSKNTNGEIFKKFVPYFFKFGPGSAQNSEVCQKYPAINNPCSMVVNSQEDLSKHMEIGYQIAHFHYILGKKNKFDFPHMCCGLSSNNVLLSLINLGYPNAAYAYSRAFDHGYTLLPFVLKNKTRGSIIIDPTSDQLWNKNPIRNAVFIKLGTKWEYKTDWAGGADLFPDRVSSIDTLRIISDFGDYRLYHKGGERFLETAFENPININKFI